MSQLRGHTPECHSLQEPCQGHKCWCSLKGTHLGCHSPINPGDTMTSPVSTTFSQENIARVPKAQSWGGGFGGPGGAPTLGGIPHPYVPPTGPHTCRCSCAVSPRRPLCPGPHLLVLRPGGCPALPGQLGTQRTSGLGGGCHALHPHLTSPPPAGPTALPGARLAVGERQDHPALPNKAWICSASVFQGVAGCDGG